MKSTIILAPLAVAVATYASAAEDTVQPPSAGSYAANIYILNTNGACMDSPGLSYAGEVSYGGLKGTTDYVRVPLSAAFGAAVSVQTLKVTKGAGTINPSGNLVWTASGNETWNVSGSFNASITEIGTHAFTALVRESYGDCTEEDQAISLVRVSADQ